MKIPSILIWVWINFITSHPIPDDIIAKMAEHESNYHIRANRKASKFYGLFQAHETLFIRYTGYNIDSMRRMPDDELALMEIYVFTKAYYEIDSLYKCNKNPIRILSIYGMGYTAYKQSDTVRVHKYIKSIIK